MSRYNAYDPGLRAEDLRAEARRERARSQESFARCDTDGFLSQWASDLNARLLDAQATIVTMGGVSDFRGLYDVSGEAPRRVAAKNVEGPYGWSWLLRDDEAERYGRKFVPESLNGKSRVQKKLRLAELREEAPAWAELHGTGHGLSGTCSVRFYRDWRRADKWGLDSTLLED